MKPMLHAEISHAISETDHRTAPVDPASPACGTPQSKVVAFLGGVGGAKMARGLTDILPPEGLTLVVNTADDFDHLGLHVSPDLDTVMYTLAGLANRETGWGLQDDTLNMLAMVGRYEGPTWFRLGDKDLATQLLRSQWLREGFPLTWVTAEMCKLLGVRHPLLPMSDGRVRTVVETDEGKMGFQEYFVRRGWQPRIRSIAFEGVEEAQPTQAVVSALRAADVVLFGPSNPFVSIDPILALPAMRRMLSASRATRVGVSPIVAGQAIRGPAAKMMREMGLDVTPHSIAHHYRDVLTGFVIDRQDEAYGTRITEELGWRVLVTETIMVNDRDRTNLARRVLEFAASH